MPAAGAAGAQNAVQLKSRRPDRGGMHRSAGRDRYPEPAAADRRYPGRQGGSRRRSQLPHSQEVTRHGPLTRWLLAPRPRVGDDAPGIRLKTTVPSGMDIMGRILPARLFAPLRRDRGRIPTGLFWDMA